MPTNHSQRNSPSGPRTGISGTVVFDAASCGAAAVTLQSVPITGVKPGDIVLLAPTDGGISVAVAIGVGYCAVADTALVPFINPTAGALDPASDTYTFNCIREH